jgi:FHA domain
MNWLFNFFAELLRRRVVRLLCAYVVVFWLLAQGFASLFPVLGIPDWVLRAFVLAAIAAIPAFAFLSWRYDLILPHVIRDPKDDATENPFLEWARNRHDGWDAGQINLRWLGADGTRKEQNFLEPISIGRDLANDVDLPDDRVSRFHAVVWAEDGGWWIRDVGSTNGTFIDRERVKAAVLLPDSCELRFHQDGPTVHTHIERPAETVVS